MKDKEIEEVFDKMRMEKKHELIHDGNMSEDEADE